MDFYNLWRPTLLTRQTQSRVFVVLKPNVFNKHLNTRSICRTRVLRVNTFRFETVKRYGVQPRCTSIGYHLSNPTEWVMKELSRIFGVYKQDQHWNWP